ncbi:GNAT family N-acetyltransferase [Streptomyces sp. NPDC056773]|uniref:GNAT family N-acetyltransferase n=1 Tax=unclassified Streptomyces TaxID=2593676 RepID=UPI0036C6CFD0
MASSATERDQVLYLRWRVFAEEFGYVDPGGDASARLCDESDTHPSVRIVIAYDQGEPVATLRLTLPGVDGAAMEVHDSWRFDGFESGERYGALSRMCILPAHRGRAVSVGLVALARREALAAGVTHFVAPATMETDHPDDARLIHDGARARGHCAAPQWATPVAPSPDGGVGLRPFYSDEERKAGVDSIDGLRYPRALDVFASLGARYVGPPHFLPDWRTYVLPLVLDLRAMPPAVTEFQF